MHCNQSEDRRKINSSIAYDKLVSFITVFRTKLFISESVVLQSYPSVRTAFEILASSSTAVQEPFAENNIKISNTNRINGLLISLKPLETMKQVIPD